MPRWISAPVLALGVLSAAEGPYAGSQACGGCHAERLKQQAASGHARALRPVAEHDLARAFRDALAARGVRPHWAFGAGHQAVTFVSRLDEDSYLEHRLSYYRSANALDVTPGHSAAGDTPGVVYRIFEPEAHIMRCFQCHSTGRLSLGPRMEIVPAELGVRCEACHGPGKAHIEAIAAGGTAAARAAIRNPGRMSAAAMNQLCGECHRQPAAGETATNWNDPWNTRHQPVYLAESACFRKSRGALSCITCHDPHAPLRTHNAAYYNAKCAGCHGGQRHPALAFAANTEDCVRCHMPEVRPDKHLRFANHWIGVYRPGAPLKPARRH